MQEKLVRYDVPFMIALSGLVWLFSYNLVIGRFEGLLLFFVLMIYIVLLIYFGRKKKDLSNESDVTNDVAKKGMSFKNLFRDLVFIAVGLTLLVYGSGWFVEGAISAARILGVSELVIGLTIVAAGTSLPEVFTSVIAAFRGERDIAVGNVVGSNIFNLLGVLGFTSFMMPDGLNISSSLLYFDLPVMFVVALFCLPIFITGKIINRKEGAFLLLIYILYVISLYFLN